MLIDDVEKLIGQSPGLTARQIAKVLFGNRGYPERVGPTCRSLCRSGRVERRGLGNSDDPFTYHATGKPDSAPAELRSGGDAFVS